MDNTGIGNRMKGYEHIPKNFLTRRTPVIMRLDGKAFHTFTRGLKKPYDSTLHEAMNKTALALCNQIQGAVFAYIQSDEISVLIRDWDTLKTDAWYGNNVQKMVSISAAIASVEFNKVFKHPYRTLTALFDSRVFSIPKEEVVNYFIWRQQDATRNSINMLGQHYFSHNQLHEKNVSQVQDMLMDRDIPINWNDVEIWAKRGSCITKTHMLDKDMEPPIFTQDRDYIDQYLDLSNERLNHDPEDLSNAFDKMARQACTTDGLDLNNE